MNGKKYKYDRVLKKKPNLKLMARISNNMHWPAWKLIVAKMLLDKGQSPDVWN